MLEKNNKRLALILVGIIALGALLIFLSQGPKPVEQTPPVAATEQPAAAPAADQAAATPPAPPAGFTPPAPAAEAPAAASQDITAPTAVPPVTDDAAATPAAPAPEAAPAPAAPATADAPAAVPATAAADNSSANLLAAPAALAIDVPAAMKDRVIGNENAPVTIIEYASLSCPHCAHFAATILPELKKQLIDTGKAKLIFRDFPLDSFALKAAEMTRCIDADKYFGLVEVVFNSQERWTQAKDPLEALQQLGSLAGMDADTFKACTQNPELENAILKGVNDAQSKYKVRSTPTFVFNDGAEILGGAQDVESFVTIVNKLTSGK